MEFVEIEFVVNHEGGESERVKLQTAVSSSEEYSMISMQRFRDLIVPRFLVQFGYQV